MNGAQALFKALTDAGLAYLRANGFKTFIVSGGGIEFMRPWTEKVYGIRPSRSLAAA
jgi:phosphoserine phosphatase